MKLPQQARYLLIDMDGTLVDTEPVGPQVFIAQLTVWQKPNIGRTRAVQKNLAT